MRLCSSCFFSGIWTDILLCLRLQDLKNDFLLKNLFTLSEKGVNIFIQSALFLFFFFWVRALGCKILFWYTDQKKRIHCKHQLFWYVLSTWNRFSSIVVKHGFVFLGFVFLIWLRFWFKRLVCSGRVEEGNAYISPFTLGWMWICILGVHNYNLSFAVSYAEHEGR